MPRLNIYHAKAIELKYQRKTYKEIEEITGGKLKVSNLQHLFQAGGLLYIPYMEYVAKHEQISLEATRKVFEKAAAIAPKIMNGILQRAIKRGDDKLAFEVLKEQMDRGGLVTVKNTVVKDDRKGSQTYAEFLADCQRRGIDPGSGLRAAAPQVESD